MNRLISIVLAASACGMLAGCGGISEVTRDRVARSESIVQQSQGRVGNSEAAALDMQRAKELMSSARRELDEKNGEAAERYAMQAQLTAELAVAKDESAQARKSADELMASIETLRREAERSPTQSTP